MLALAGTDIQLVPDGTLILHVLLIVIMVGVLSRSLFRPLNKVLAERESTTKGHANEARDLSRRVSEMLAQYERKLRGARTEGYAMMERKKAETLREREEKVLAFKEEINKWVGEQKQSLETQSTAAREKLQSESHATALKIASRILQRPIRGNA